MTHWHVLYTKPNKEKKVLAQLTKMDIKAYCPMTTSIRQWSDRKKKYGRPYLHGYSLLIVLRRTATKYLKYPERNTTSIFAGNLPWYHRVTLTNCRIP